MRPSRVAKHRFGLTSPVGGASFSSEQSLERASEASGSRPSAELGSQTRRKQGASSPGGSIGESGFPFRKNQSGRPRSMRPGPAICPGHVFDAVGPGPVATTCQDRESRTVTAAPMTYFHPDNADRRSGRIRDLEMAEVEGPRLV